MVSEFFRGMYIYRGELGTIKCLYLTNSTDTLKQIVVEDVKIMPQRRHHTHSSDNYSSLFCMVFLFGSHIFSWMNSYGDSLTWDLNKMTIQYWGSVFISFFSQNIPHVPVSTK